MNFCVSFIVGLLFALGLGALAAFLFLGSVETVELPSPEFEQQSTVDLIFPTSTPSGQQLTATSIIRQATEFSATDTPAVIASITPLPSPTLRQTSTLAPLQMTATSIIQSATETAQFQQGVAATATAFSAATPTAAQ